MPMAVARGNFHLAESQCQLRKPHVQRFDFFTDLGMSSVFPLSDAIGLGDSSGRISLHLVLL